MYVCVCNAVTDRHICEAVADGCHSMRELRERLGVGACCGRCKTCAHKVMHKAIANAAATKEIRFTTTTA